MLDIELERFKRALLFYEEKVDPSLSYILKIGQCQQSILDYTIKKDAAKRKLRVSENKKRLHLEEWEFYRNRNPQKNSDSWQNFDLNTIPLKMVGASDDIAGETLGQISSKEMLYIRYEVEKVFKPAPEVVAAPEEEKKPREPEAKSKKTRARANDLLKTKVEVEYDKKKKQIPNQSYSYYAERIAGDPTIKMVRVNGEPYSHPKRVIEDWLKKYDKEQS